MSQSSAISSALEREFAILEDVEREIVARGIYSYRASRGLSEISRLLPIESVPAVIGQENEFRPGGKPQYDELELKSKRELISILLSGGPRVGYFDLTAKEGAFLSDEEELFLSFADSASFEKYVDKLDRGIPAFNSALVNAEILERMPEAWRKGVYETLAQFPEGFSLERSRRGYRAVLPKTGSENKGGESRGKFWKYFGENFLSEMASDLEIMSLANVGEAKARKYLEEKAREASWGFQQARPLHITSGEDRYIARK